MICFATGAMPPPKSTSPATKAKVWVARLETMRHSMAMWLAANLAQLGHLDEARAEAAEVLRIDPKYTIDDHRRRAARFKRPEDAEHLFDGLRKANLPER